MSLNVFNESLMNDAVYKFKRYEDASLVYTGIDRHEGEDVGLYSTTISRADYDAMAGQLADSMAAPERRADDIPQRPVFVNIPADEGDEEDEIPAAPAAKKEEKRAPIAPPEKTARSTYRPAYVPPTAAPAPAAKKPETHTDTSTVRPGTAVTHKAFGTGTVKSIDGGFIIVTFGREDKKFYFPAAFDQGFLKQAE